MASVVAQVPFNEYVGNGVATTYPFEFEISASNELLVTVGGVAQTAYTIVGVGSQVGGDVQFAAPPIVGSPILIQRRVLLERDTDYQYSGDFREETVDRDFNRLWRALQDVDSNGRGALRAPFPYKIGELPGAAARAYNALVFDGAGDPAVAAALPAGQFQFGVPYRDKFPAGSYASFPLSANPGLLNNIRLFAGGVEQFAVDDWTWTSADPLNVYPVTPFPTDVKFEIRYTQALPLGVVTAENVAFLGESSGSSLIGFQQAGSSVVSTVGDKLLNLVVSVTDFMTVAQKADYKARTLTLDLTAPFQAAINSLTTGAELDLGTGSAKITAALTVNVSGITISGRGYQTNIVCANLTSDVFLVGNASTETTGLLFRNFRVSGSVVKTAGYVFNNRLITNSRWENVFAGSLKDYVAAGNSHRLWDGYYFDRFSEVVITGGQCVVAQTAVKARGNADQSFGAELLLDGNFRIVYAGLRGIWLGGACGGIYLNRIDVSVCRTGLYIDDTLQAGVPNRELFMTKNTTIDSCTGWGINIETNGLSVLDAPGVWVGACGSVATGEGGIRVAASVGAILSAVWGPVRVQSNYQDGMQLNSGTHVISGGVIRNNGTGAPGGHGITLGNAAIADFVITGSVVNNNGNATRGYGWANVASAPNYTVTNNRFSGNGQGPIVNASGITTPASQVIRDNSGYVSENSSVATVANGTAAIVVNHGLSETPTSVLLTWAGAPDAAILYAAPSDFTPTQFTIRTSANVSAARPVAWRAVRGAG